MEDMGRPESTGTFEDRLGQAIAEAAALDAKVKENYKTLDVVDAQADGDREAVAAQEADKAQEDEEWAIKYAGCYLDELQEEEDRQDTQDPWQMRVEVILARKVHKGKLYYKVLWKQRNCVSWELEDNIDDKQKIFDFEKLYKQRYAQPTEKRLPVTYITRRQLALAAKNDPLTAHRLEESKKGAGIWSCEVEPMIWIPYDEGSQRRLEDAFGRGLKSGTVFIEGREYIISFEHMRQNLGNVLRESEASSGRKVQRVVQLPEAEERRKMMAMSVDELRTHIASIQDFQPVHYEMLSRLHELDKVVTHASTTELKTALHHTTFEAILNQIAEGAEFPGFSMECFICLEDYKGTDEVSVLPGCGHFYHKKCAEDYFKQYSKLCPVCKVPIC